MPPIEPREFWLLLPEIFLAACGMLLLVLSARSEGSDAASGRVVLDRRRRWSAGLMAFWARGEAPDGPFLAGMFVLDAYALFWKVLFLAGDHSDRDAALGPLPRSGASTAPVSITRSFCWPRPACC